MLNKPQSCNSLFHTISHVATAALALAIVFALAAVQSQSAQGQTFKVLHNFTGGSDGTTPYAGLTIDKAGNLYGTAAYGGTHCGGQLLPYCGTVFGYYRHRVRAGCLPLLQVPRNAGTRL